MFKHSLLESVNVFCKLLSLYIFTISIIFVQDSVFFMMLSFFFFVLLHRHRYTGVMSLMATLVAILAIFYPHLLWISKVLIFITYVCLLTKFIHVSMLKYFFEKTFYRFQNQSFTTFIITILYLPGLLKKNWFKMDSVRKDYGLNEKKNYYINLWKRVFRISFLELKEIVLFHKLRLYNCKKVRTSVDEIHWEKWDTSYLGMHILFFLIVAVWGR